MNKTDNKTWGGKGDLINYRKRDDIEKNDWTSKPAV